MLPTARLARRAPPLFEESLDHGRRSHIRPYGELLC
jgi:hypothetical protein